MNRAVLEKIIDSGIRAPSGENSQPWRFTAQKNSLSIYNVPERDLSLYNFEQLGSMVAHGALIENMAIAAPALGYEAKVSLFPPSADENHVATLTFEEKENPRKDPLYEYIPHRMANRTSYEDRALDAAARNALLSVRGIGARAAFIEDPAQKKKLAEAMSYGDQLLFENTKLLNFLFHNIHWNLEEASQVKSGFYVKELALKPPQEAVFRLLQNKAALRLFNKIGFPKIAAKGNVGLYANVSAIGAVIMQNGAKEDFVNGGRIMERVWLTATQLGYSIQPLTAIIFFMQRILKGDTRDFAEAQIEGIKKAYETIKNEFGVKEGTFAMLFRIGRGKEISRRSFRRAPEIIYQA